MLFSKNKIALVIFVIPFITTYVSLSKSLANDKPISITVRKIPETVDKIPATVTVLGQKTIKDASIRSPSDISSRIPGFSFNDPFGRFNPAPSFRGLIQPGLGDDPSVGFFNDGLYLSGRSSINSLAFDLDRIESSKGPSNALYGRNSFGGSINAVSAKPDSKYGAWFDGRAGQYNRYEVQAGLNVPLLDNFKARLALYGRDWGGYFDNVVVGGPDIGRERTKAGRLSLMFDPTPDRNILLRLTHIQDQDGQPKGFLTPANCGPRISDGQLRLFCGEIPNKSPNGYAANNVGTEQTMGYIRDHTRATMEWIENIAARTTLTNLIGGSVEDSVFIRDDDYQAVNAARAGIDTDRFDVQWDMRLNHKTDDGLWNGLLGINLYKFNNNVDRIDQLYVLGQTSPGGPKTKGVTETTGIYGSLTRDLGHGFSITGDARWQYEAKTLKSSTKAITTGLPIDLKDEWTAFTPKGTVSWTARNNLLFYGSVANGYKTGGFNDRANIFDSERNYAPEENITYEWGIKNIPVHKTVSADFGLFWIDWMDQQVTAYSSAGTTQNFYINNAGQTTVKGIEAALRWNPIPDFLMDFGYTYADARFDKYRDPDLTNVLGFSPTGDVSGNRLPRYSPHHLNISGFYKTPSPIPEWNLVTTGQFTWQSSQFTDNSNTSKTGDRTLLNLQTAVEKDNVSLGLWIDNALNEKDPAVGIPWTDASQGFRREWLVVPQDGTTVGLRFSVKW